VALVTEALAKVLAGSRPAEAGKCFERVLPVRTRLGAKSGPAAEIGALCNDCGLFLKRFAEPARGGDATRLRVDSSDNLTR
jgi:hypothetical protein